VPPKHRAELIQAKELAFEDIAFCVAFQALLIPPNLTARRNSVELLIIAEEVVWEAFDVPNPTHRKRLQILFNHFAKQ
jgi:hypothetical protein